MEKLEPVSQAVAQIRQVLAGARLCCGRGGQKRSAGVELQGAGLGLGHSVPLMPTEILKEIAVYVQITSTTILLFICRYKYFYFIPYIFHFDFILYFYCCFWFSLVYIIVPYHL